MPVERGGARASGVRIHQAIARQLGTEILAGVHAPGANLGGEIEQSEALKVSRTAYREAIRMLAAKGLIESRPKAGTQVTPRWRWNLLDPEILAWMFSGKPDERFVRDLFELRAIIEPEAATLAAARRTDSHLAQMRDALATMQQHRLITAEGQAADRQFHRVMLEASGNEAITALASSVEAAVQWTTHFKQRVSGLPRDPVPDHFRVFEAIAASDGEASRLAMRELVALAYADMKLEKV